MDRHNIPSLIIWEHYLVYAVSLGVAKEVLKQLQIVYPDLREGQHQFGYGWYYYSHTGTGLTDVGRNINNLTNSIRQSVQSAIRTATSSSRQAQAQAADFPAAAVAVAAAAAGVPAKQIKKPPLYSYFLRIKRGFLMI
jgi:hypothetical protein